MHSKMVFQKEAKPGIVYFLVLNSERYRFCLSRIAHAPKWDPIYTKVSMTTYAICALGQFTEEEEDGENVWFGHFPCVYNVMSF